jgi:hypothetical protein
MNAGRHSSNLDAYLQQELDVSGMEIAFIAMVVGSVAVFSAMLANVSRSRKP